ncbi:MAG: phosphoribosylformylglycinamidine synthase subunit PurQ [Candidatus Micrarchaeota archaeon]|nr:phosphoribosylformylglycinamidine synthase subunit PurQ [Candidatus Micrarchaeota archaeon]
MPAKKAKRMGKSPKPQKKKSKKSMKMKKPMKQKKQAKLKITLKKKPKTKVQTIKKPVHKMKAMAKEKLITRKPKCLILAGFGLNSEVELAHAFALAGADASIVHFSDITSGKARLSNYQIFAIPGGWSFADELGAGRVLANKLGSTFKKQFEAFVASGKPVIGICNGFQVLVKLGALPNAGAAFQQEATLTQNASGKFEDRWVYLAPQKSVCKYLEGVPFIHCPVRHGEGRLVVRDEKELVALEKKGFVVLKYSDEKGNTEVGYPLNPNGSPRNIAGICDSTGKIFALMPHPEVAVRAECFPRFTAGISHEKNSIRFFQNIVKAAEEYI